MRVRERQREIEKRLRSTDVEEERRETRRAVRRLFADSGDGPVSLARIDDDSLGEGATERRALSTPTTRVGRPRETTVVKLIAVAIVTLSSYVSMHAGSNIIS